MIRTQSGGLVVYGHGGRSAGTAATGWLLANVLFQSLSDFDQTWYIYQWTDLGDLGPDSSDDFVLRASGS